MREVPHHRYSEIVALECISKSKAIDNPYHLGAISPDFTSGKLDGMDRATHLDHPGWWLLDQPDEDEPAFKAWRPWEWSNDHERELFLSWYNSHFSQWTKEEWERKSLRMHAGSMGVQQTVF